MDDNEMWRVVQTCDLAEASKAVFDQYFSDRQELNQQLKKLGVTRKQMSLVFKRYYDMKPAEYLIQVRIAAAKQALQVGASVFDAAADSGYPAFMPISASCPGCRRLSTGSFLPKISPGPSWTRQSGRSELLLPKRPSSALNRKIILRKRLAELQSKSRLTGLSQMTRPETWLRPA